MNPREFLLQIALVLAGAVIGLIGQMLRMEQQRTMARVLAALLIVASLLWIVLDAANPVAAPSEPPSTIPQDNRQVTVESEELSSITAQPGPTNAATSTIDPAEVLQTATPTTTSTPVPSRTATSSPTLSPTYTPTVQLGLPLGSWDVRAYRTDDANAVLLNSHIVAGASFRSETDWIKIDSSFRADAPNFVTFVNINSIGPGIWGFSLRNNGTVLWGHEGEAVGPGIAYFQTIQVFPDNSVQEVDFAKPTTQSIDGSWSVRAIAEDIGVITVNGIPISASFSQKDLGWIEVSNLLSAEHTNQIDFSAWNSGGGHAWDFALRKGEAIIWGNQDFSSGPAGEVFFATVQIDPMGNLVP